MNKKRTIDYSKLVGRQVYFKLSKKALAESDILNLTVGKLYTVEKVWNGDLGKVVDDTGRPIAIVLGRQDYKCAYLDHLTYWILKRESKKESKSNG